MLIVCREAQCHCRSELAREKPKGNALINTRVNVDYFREQARSYRGATEIIEISV